MENNNADEPAFAAASISLDGKIYQPGLTKREYFAAIAMQGLLSTSQAMDALPQHVAECARINADALIEELNKE